MPRAALLALAAALAGCADEPRASPPASDEVPSPASDEPPVATAPAPADPPTPSASAARPSFALGAQESDRTFHVAHLDVVDRPGDERRRAIVVPLRGRRWVDLELDAPDEVEISVRPEAAVATGPDRRLTLDLHEMILDADAARIGTATSPDSVGASFDVDIEVARGDARTSGRIRGFFPGELQVQLARELAAVARTPLAWAAEPGDARPRPVIRVLVEPSEGMYFEADRDLRPDGTLAPHPGTHLQIDARLLPAPHRVRDVELVAIEELRDVQLEVCPCLLDEIAGPMEGLDSELTRVRTDSRVTIYQARTGRRVASRTFRGDEPGRCTRDMGCSSFLGLYSRRERDVDEWIREIATAL
jgi:hypothetical protein